MKSAKPIFLTVMMAFITQLCFSQTFEGYALYNEQNNKTAYLVDSEGDIVHSWSCNVACNYAVLLKENGNIMRGGVYSSNRLSGAAVGGMVQEIAPNGDVVWEFVYSNSDHVSHHDITLMPDGNVLMTAWEVKSASEMEAAGYTGNKERWVTHFIEVAQDGTGGKIVWEWHMFDHLVQDDDDTKDNFGVVKDHPELLNANIPISGSSRDNDWLHVNGVDYNPDLDQIVFSSRFLSEIFVIDHSTTTAEAASHSGGNAGMGGDFLYRWGNPGNYDMSGDQVIPAAVHDARWIEDDGRPNGGFIQIFNNEGNNGNSTVDAIDPPLNGYNYDRTTGKAYEPAVHTWRHECRDNASGQSAHNRMANGNTFVCLSREYMYEVDKDDNLVWQHSAKPAKAFRYTCDDTGIKALLDEPCTPTSIEQLVSTEIELFPNPTSGIIQIAGVSEGSAVNNVAVFDGQGREVRYQQSLNQIDISNEVSGIYLIHVTLENNHTFTKKVSLRK